MLSMTAASALGRFSVTCSTAVKNMVHNDGAGTHPCRRPSSTSNVSEHSPSSSRTLLAYRHTNAHTILKRKEKLERWYSNHGLDVQSRAFYHTAEPKSWGRGGVVFRPRNNPPMMYSSTAVRMFPTRSATPHTTHPRTYWDVLKKCACFSVRTHRLGFLVRPY